jgi:hypothetical protein
VPAAGHNKCSETGVVKTIFFYWILKLFVKGLLEVHLNNSA